MTLGFPGTERPVAEAEADVESRASTGGRLSLALTPCAGDSQISPERRWRAAARGFEARLMQPVAMPKLGTALALPHPPLSFAGISLYEFLQSGSGILRLRYGFPVCKIAKDTAA
jgi:hypothetical protein